MFTQLVGSVVLNSVAAAAADVTLTKGNVTFAGLGVTIPLRKVLKSNAYRKTVSAAGTAQTSTFTIVAPDNSTAYTLMINKFPATQVGLQQGNALYTGIEQYTIFSDATATATEVAAAFAAAITTAIAAGTSGLATATNAAGVLTLVGGSANFSFLVSMSPNLNSSGSVIGTQATTVVLVPTAGTYAQVYAINHNATSGLVYTELSYRWYEDEGDDVLHQATDQEGCFEVKVFLNEADGDTAALITACDAIAAGTGKAGTGDADAATYLGF